MQNGAEESLRAHLRRALLNVCAAARAAGRGAAVPAAEKMDMPAASPKPQAGGGETSYDKGWAQMMIKHHKAALPMAEDEIAKGSSAQMKTLARAILTAQKAQIKEMEDWLEKQKES